MVLFKLGAVSIIISKWIKISKLMMFSRTICIKWKLKTMQSNFIKCKRYQLHCWKHETCAEKRGTCLSLYSTEPRKLSSDQPSLNSISWFIWYYDWNCSQFEQNQNFIFLLFSWNNIGDILNFKSARLKVNFLPYYKNASYIEIAS